MTVTNRPVQRGKAYNLFIVVLTLFSLLIMVVLLLPLSDATVQLLQVYDTLICIIFLFDFGMTLGKAPDKRDYFIHQRGWLDLLGSIPSLGFFKYSGLLRLARLSRLARILRAMRGENKKRILADVARNRGQYAVFITLLSALIVLTTASTLVLEFESRSPEANIKTPGDALWWAVVTVTTVGYGDRYPTTGAGRITAVFVMTTGIGIIGALASILASILVPPSSPAPEQENESPPTPDVAQELAAIKTQLAALQQLMEKKEEEREKGKEREKV
jgi:voltage-gated potassium channel